MASLSPQGEPNEDAKVLVFPVQQEQPLLTKVWSNSYAMVPIYTGVLGTGMGVTAASLQGQSKLLYGLHMGIGYGIFGGVYSASLYGMRQVRGGEDDVKNWVVAGATSGAVTSLLTGGPRKMVPGAMTFGALGVLAYYVCGALNWTVEDYKASRADEMLLKGKDKA